MRHIRTLMFGLLMTASIVCVQAQIGYQICLLNTATGEPRANERVNVTVNLTNNAGGVIYTGDQSATTNDFGILSLTIGNKDTFKDVDLSKLPFWIEVRANGVVIGKSQVLSIPVAEVAKRLAPIDENLILGTWMYKKNKSIEMTYIFNEGGRGLFIFKDYYDDGRVGNQHTSSFSYEIYGRLIYIYSVEGSFEGMGFPLYYTKNGKLTDGYALFSK